MTSRQLGQLQSLSIENAMDNVINHNKPRHSRESRSPDETWISGQAWNDKLRRTSVVVYSLDTHDSNHLSTSR
jgi:hypothetical protein